MMMARLKRFIRRLLVSVAERRRLPAPSERERALIAELRDGIGRLPQPPAAVPGPATPDGAWTDNRRRLRQLVATEDPRAFLRWDVIRHTMFVLDADYIRTELRELERSAGWAARWRPAIIEERAGLPARSLYFRRSSCNLIHQAYHLLAYEGRSGNRVEKLSSIVELGGGYGCLCRLVHRLGFRGRYLIIDLPELSLLQRFYLRLVGLDVRDAPFAPEEPAGIRCTTDLDEALSFLRSEPAGLFVATWSLSETPVAFREPVLRDAALARSLLIAYQDRFEGVDNADLFERWRRSVPGVTWHASPIPHLAGNHYLIGARRPVSEP